MDEELLQYYFNDEGEQFTNNDSEFETDIEDEDNSIVETEPTDLENRVNETVLTPDEYTPITSPNIGTPGESIPEVESPLAPIEVPDPTYKTETMTEIISLTEFDEEYLLELKENGFKFYANYTDGTKEEVPYTEVYDLIEANPGVITFTADSIGAASNQHFWNDGNGAHVSDNPKEDWEQNDTYIYDPVNNPIVDKIDDYYELSGTSYIKTTDKIIDDEKTYYVRVHTLSNLNDTNYHNILINSLGILLRKAYVNYAMFSRSNVAFFDGAGNDEENILAYFGAMSAQIGRSNSNHVVITSNGVTAYKGDGTLDELTAIVDGANLKNATITGSKIANSTIENSNIKNGTITGTKIDNGTIENSNIKDGTITGSKIQGSTLTNIPYAEIDQLKTRNVTADAIQAATGFVASLATNSITAAKLVADQGIIDNLETNFAHIQNGVIDNANINVANVNGLSANYAHITNGVIDNAKIGHADVNGLSANYASVGALSAETARVDTLVANTADLATIRANAAKVTNLTAAELEADHATVGSLDTNYAQIDMANVNNTWIQNGTIKDAAISDGMINSVSANKLTAGTIDASNITVTNLNADNITTGTINGQRIGAGSLSLDKLSEDVYTETEVDSIVSNLQTQIDGAIETWTGTTIPTLQNAPASSWTTNSIKDTHVGDVYFIVNSQSNQNGYNYRFTKSGTGNNVTYSWQLIKDSDVTNALARLSTAEGKITTFDSDISQLKTDTGTLTTKTTSLETRMSNAEADILDKVDTTTFNEVSDTVDSHSQSITQMTTTLSNKADSSTVSSLTTRVSKNEQDISGINSTIGSLETTVESKADGSTVETVSSNLNTLTQTVNGHTQTISSMQNIQTSIQGNAIKSTVQLWFTKANTTAPSKPTAHVTTDNAATANAWNLAVPTYNASYPNYYYCYEYEYLNGTYGWSAVTRDIATGEMQERARTAISNASTADGKAVAAQNTANSADGKAVAAQNTANKNVKESVQLWCTKASNTAPSKPTTAVTSTATTGNAWTTKVPAYSSSYPYYFYCMQYKLADGTYTWSDVVYDQATTETQSVSRTTSSNLSTVTTQVANISDTVNGHTSQLSTTTTSLTTLRTDFDNLEIGGRNLLPGTEDLSGFVQNTTDITIVDGVALIPGNGAGWDVLYTPLIPFSRVDGYDIVLSFEYKAASNTDTWIVTEGTATDTPRTNRTKYRDHHMTLQQSTVWTTYSIVFNDMSPAYLSSGSGDVNYFRIAFYDRTSNSNLEFRRPMLERGNKPTDWTPAPEDLENYADNAANNAANAVPRMSKINTPQKTFTTAQWKTYGAYGRVEQWMTGSSYDNSHLRVGDRAYVTGIISDQMKGTATIIGEVTELNPSLTGTNLVAMKSEQLIFGGDAVSAIQTSLSTTQSDYATFKQTTQQFESTVGTTYATKTELKTTDDKIENLEIGGRNLLKGTSSDWTEVSLLASSYYFEVHTDYALEIGQTYTFSIVVEKVSSDNVPINLHIGNGEQGYYTHDIGWFKNNIPFGEVVSITHTITEANLARSSDTTIAPYFSYRLRNEKQATTIRYRNVKLEKGNKATDWTPAPEDANAAIVAVESRVTNAETSITQTNNQIALKANASDVYTKTQTDGLISTEVTNRNSAINQKADAITASVASTYTTKTDFNNLEIGGRNLLLRTGSDFFTGTNPSLSNTSNIVGSASTSYITDEAFPGFEVLQTVRSNSSTTEGRYFFMVRSRTTAKALEVGETYTLSFMAKASTDGVTFYYQSFMERTTTVKYSSLALTTEWTKFWITFIVREGYTDTATCFYTTGTANATYWVTQLKLEKGNKPTDWSPAPEDLEAYTDTQVNAAKAAIKITTDNITSEVSKISSSKYVTSATASWSLPNIKTLAAEGYTGTWSITSSANLRVGDTVYIKGTDSTRNCSVYIKVTVTNITSSASITGVSHGYEDVLPVETIKSTINQSSDSVKIQAKHVEIDGAAIFTSISSDVDSAITSKGYATTSQVNTAKTEAINSANGSTDTKLQSYSTTTQMNSAIGTAKTEAINSAALDATSKANAAEQNAKNAIPTDISELNNDTGFITSDVVPTKVSDLTNDSGFQTSNQVNTAITSKGYQTSSQVESAITSKGYATTTQAQGYADTAESNAKTYAEGQASTVNSALESYKSITNSTLTSLQNQVDGQIEAWYKTVDPTSSNEPASTWNTNELKARHEGDLYYNVNNGHSWRWLNNGGTYSWQQIPDSDAAAALAAAQNAQTSANTKRRIFTTTPTVPYDVGDLWVNGTQIKYANVSRSSTQSYTASDWVLTATDDSNIPTNVSELTNDANYGTTSQIATAKTEAISSANSNTDTKLQSYSTTTQMNSAIGTAKTEAINSANGSTDTKLQSYSTTTQMNSAIGTAKTEAINSANSNTDTKLQSYSTTTQMNSAIGTAKTEAINASYANYGYKYHKDIVVYGNSDKYYPVYFDNNGADYSQDVPHDLLIKRGYSEQAPSDWYTSTHKGSLTLRVRWNYGGWGGATYNVQLYEWSEQYSTIVGDILVGNKSGMNSTIYLRGGGTTGALYHLYSDVAFDTTRYGATFPYIGTTTPGTVYMQSGTYTWTVDNPLTTPNKTHILSLAAVTEEQYIYISKASGTNSVASNDTWVTANSDSQNTWTTKRPTYNASYPVLFVAKQKKTATGHVICTTPVKDDTTTIIDGGHITTGTIDASRVTVTNLDASKITTGSLSADRIKANVIDAVNNGTGTINADKINASALSIGYSQLSGTPTIPTKVSQLTNDSSYATTTQLPTKVSQLTNDSSYATTAQLATKSNKTHPDTRNDNQLPSWYFTNYPRQTIKEFKYANKIGIGSSSVYCTLETTVPWNDSSGGYPTQTTIVNKVKYSRVGIDASTWSPWVTDNTSVVVSCVAIDYSNSTASLKALLYIDGVATTTNVSYQWLKDGTAISGATSQTLAVTSAMGLNHIYSCTVTY